MGVYYGGRPKVEHRDVEGEKCKECTKCNIWKPLKDFNKKKDMSDGLRSACRECQRQDSKRYRQENLEKERKRSKENRIRYRGYHREYSKNWEKRNREKRYMYTQNRRARLKELPNTLTQQEWEEIKRKFNYSCAYCGEEEDLLEYEHFTPLTKDKRWGTSKENIIPACQYCNRSKWDNYFEEWYPTYEHFSEEKKYFIKDHIRKMREGALGEKTG